MKWTAIESTAIMAAAYVRQERILYLKFHSGEIYRYFDFPPEQFDDFLASDSKGRYFAYNIRGRFPFEPVEERGHRPAA